MAGHRSPNGTRASRAAGTPRHHAARRPAPAGPSLRTTVLASASALGAVATGTFSLITPGDATGTAEAADAPQRFEGTLAATTALLADLPSDATPVASVTLVEQVKGADIARSHLAQLDKAATLAAERAEREAEERRRAEEQARLARLIEKGGVDGWIAEALDVMDLSQEVAPGIKKIIMAESGGNPRAINNWDSNARAGTPSQGLMQTIPSTFRAYVHPELADEGITHPIANITAGVRYMIDRYGMDTLEAGGRSSAGGGYLGY